MGHDGYAAVALEAVPHAGGYQAACLGLQAGFLVVVHARHAIHVLEEDVSGADSLPYKLLVEGEQRAVESVGAGDA